MERRFTIQEWGQHTRPDQPITESELKRRLSVIMCYGPDDRVDWDTCIHRLLYGTEKVEVNTEPAGFTCRIDAQPDPWEEWV